MKFPSKSSTKIHKANFALAAIISVAAAATAQAKDSNYEKGLEAKMETFSKKILKCHPLQSVKAPTERNDQLDLIITPQGKVQKAEITSSIPLSPSSETCIQKEFLTIKFQKPPGDENYPFQANFTYNLPIESAWKNVADVEESTTTINSYSGELGKCYKEFLDDDKEKKFEGDVTIAWTVAPTGKVQNVRFPKNELKSEKLKKCIREKMLTWTFPKPKGKGTAEMDYTFSFYEKQ